MFDLSTIMKAIELVGPITDAGKRLYDAFVPLVSETDQDKLKTAYAKAVAASDAEHDELQSELKA